MQEIADKGPEISRHWGSQALRSLEVVKVMDEERELKQSAEVLEYLDLKEDFGYDSTSNDFEGLLNSGNFEDYFYLQEVIVDGI